MPDSNERQGKEEDHSQSGFPAFFAMSEGPGIYFWTISAVGHIREQSHKVTSLVAEDTFFGRWR